LKALAIAGCVLLGGFAVARAWLVPLTYDEAASYLRYISQDFLSIFNFEVATNHLLNTLPTWLVARAAGSGELPLRAASLIGYVCYLYFGVLMLRRVRHRAIAVAGFVLLNLNPYLLDYFALSRGYGISLGALMGALYFLLRAAAARQAGGAALGDVSRALTFGCAAVMAGFSMLDAWLGIAAVAFATVWWFKPGGSASAPPVPHDDARRSRAAALAPLAGAAALTGLVLSQDHRLTDRLYEPITVTVAGLEPADIEAIKASRINLRRRPEAVARQAGSTAWRVDPPSATRGLRLELPAGAAEKIRDGRAFIETVIGSRPFVHRRGQEDGWTERDDAPGVFESEAALSLPRSWMAQYRPVINWSGDRVHLGWVAVRTGIVLAILAGLAATLSALGWLFDRLSIVTAEDWRPLMIGALWLAGLAGTPLYLLRRGDELYFGGVRGFVDDTVYSLIENSFYGRSYVAGETHAIFWIVVALALSIPVAAVYRYRRRAVVEALPASCLFGVLLVASAAVIAQHWILGTPYLLSRTALFYLPVFVLFATFVCDALAGLGSGARIAACAAAVSAAVLLGAHFAVTANVTYTWDWKKDAGTRAMVDDLVRAVDDEQPRGARVVLGVEPDYSAATAYYLERRRSTIEMDTIPTPRRVDFFYLDERNVGLLSSLSAIARYPVAGSVLARPPRPATSAAGTGR
jgi:hypothetical protein